MPRDQKHGVPTIDPSSSETGKEMFQKGDQVWFVARVYDDLSDAFVDRRLNGKIGTSEVYKGKRLYEIYPNDRSLDMEVREESAIFPAAGVAAARSSLSSSSTSALGGTSSRSLAGSSFGSSAPPIKATESADEKPKRSRSAFQLYCTATRSTVKLANPNAKVTEINKILKANYAALPAAEKAPWEKTAAADKVVYQKALEEFSAKAPHNLSSLNDEEQAIVPSKLLGE